MFSPDGGGRFFATIGVLTNDRRGVAKSIPCRRGADKRRRRNKKAPQIAGLFTKKLWFLFSNNFKFNVSTLAVAKFDSRFICSQFFYIISDIDLLAVNLITFLVTDGTADL